jgi:hypothetical protein
VARDHAHVKQPDIIKGPASGRRLLRQFGLTGNIVEQTKGTKKSAPKKAPAKKTTAKAKTQPKAQKARRNQPRTRSEKANEVTTRRDPSIVKNCGICGEKLSGEIGEFAKNGDSVVAHAQCGIDG